MIEQPPPANPNAPPRSHIVSFSGGVTSWAAAKRVVEHYGPEQTTLLTADTGGEAEDWLDHVHASAKDVGAAEHVIVRSAKYTDIYDLAVKTSSIPSVIRGTCTIELKVVPITRWIYDHAAPGYTQHFGFDWTEQHRLDKLRASAARYDGVDDHQRIQAPLLWNPLIDKSQCLDMLAASGLTMPAAYKEGHAHNNCLATGCFKANRKAWLKLLEQRPEAYIRSERFEADFRTHINPSSAILPADTAERRQGKHGPTLKELRTRYHNSPKLPIAVDDSPCSCFTADDLDELAARQATNPDLIAKGEYLADYRARSTANPD